MENKNKLSVLQRSSNNTGWHPSSHFTPDQINKINVIASKNDKSLNAIPSPLARIHLFDSAFRLVSQDTSDNEHNSGDAYRKLVSDCFDVFELIYNWNSHVREGKKLELTTWDASIELTKLQSLFNTEKEKHKKNKTKDLLTKNIPGYKHNLVAKTLLLFLKQKTLDNFKIFHIIKVDGKAIAGSSPLTGFFTTPNPLTDFKLANPTNNKKAYFSNTRLFNERTAEIKKFIYSFFVDNEEIFSSKLPIREYLEHHVNEVDQNTILNLNKINANEKTILNSITLSSNSGRVVSDLFEPTIIRVSYKLNEECFYSPKYLNDNPERNHDYLLPFTEEFFNSIDIKKIPSLVTVEEKVFKNTKGEDEYTVVVVVKYNDKELKKTYQTNRQDELGVEGKIIDLKDTFSIQLDLAIFPFFKVKEEEKIVSTNDNSAQVNLVSYNDYYRLLFATQDGNFVYDNDDFRLSFGKDGKIVDPSKTEYQTYSENRTLNGKTTSPIGSKYYALNYCFDFIQIELPKFEEFDVKCMVAPRWIEKNLKGGQIDFAIDFGTTTTFVAYTDPNSSKFPERFSLKHDQKPVALLNKPKQHEKGRRWIDCFEYYSLTQFHELFEVQQQEFVPSIIDNEEYGFPFRTAVYESKNIVAKKISLVNSNISFTYQKKLDRATEGFNNYLTNLKWNVKADDKFKESVEVFIEELLHLLRLKALYNNSDPRKSKISWFSPLSFTPGAQFLYNQIWEEKYRQIFKGNPEGHLRNVTESEAPYYFYSKGDVSGVEKIANPSSVLTLDIGGGTTDIMYFKGDVPKMGASVHFGANVLWGDGYNEFTNSKNNGIYNSIKGAITEKLNPTELKSLNDRLNKPDSEFGSDEILNFWILNYEKSEVLKALNNGEFKFSYLLHLSSLIYHSCKLIKQHSHLNAAPNCFIFTGNGSRYLDLIQSKSHIEKICGFFIREIFTKDAANPQIILPDTNRKEATCFGGLYQPFTSGKIFDELNYLGFEEAGEKYPKYKDIDIRKEVIFDKLSRSFESFINCFFSMNDDAELAFKKHFDIHSNLTALKNFILSKAKENLESGYTMRKKSVGSEDDITDSLFFYPLVELLYRINKLSKKDLNDFIPRTIIFAPNPDSENGFSVNIVTTQKKTDSVFAITIDDSHPDHGEMTIIGEATIHKKALTGINSFLPLVCEFKEFPDVSHQNIDVIVPGRLEKVNSTWVVVQKIIIEFS